MIPIIRRDLARSRVGNNECPDLELPGAGNRRTVRKVLALAKTNIPKLVFLCETRQASMKMEKLRWRFGLKGFYGLCSSGLSGGIAFY